jgi:hypothetical protein
VMLSGRHEDKPRSQSASPCGLHRRYRIGKPDLTTRSLP